MTSGPVDRIADVWGPRTAHARGTVWPPRVDRHLEPDIAEGDVERWVQMLGTLVQTTWTVVVQGAKALRDHELPHLAEEANKNTFRQLSWLTTRMNSAGPQALPVAS